MIFKAQNIRMVRSSFLLSSIKLNWKSIWMGRDRLTHLAVHCEHLPASILYEFASATAKTLGKPKFLSFFIFIFFFKLLRITILLLIVLKLFRIWFSFQFKSSSPCYRQFPLSLFLLLLFLITFPEAII